MPNQWTLNISKVGPTEEQLKQICEAAEQGYSISSCAATADVSKNTLERWLAQGRKAVRVLEDGGEVRDVEMIYASIAEKFDRARARGVKHLEDVSTTRAREGMGTWTEALTKLERGHRDEFGKQPDLVQSAGPVVIVIDSRPGREIPEGEIVEGELVGSDDNDLGALRAATSTASVSEQQG